MSSCERGDLSHIVEFLSYSNFKPLQFVTVSFNERLIHYYISPHLMPLPRCHTPS